MKKIFTLFVAFLALTFCAKAQVTIILEAHDVWGDGTGYQLLLDADHNTFGTIIPETGGLTASGDAPASVYAEFEYKVPVNADGSLTTTNIVYDGSVTITIPAGTYDFCITNPTPDDRMWIAGGGVDPTRADDYVFLDGRTYHFLMGTDGYNDNCTMTVTYNPTEPTIVASPETINFGNVTLGNYGEATVTVNNFLLNNAVSATTSTPFTISTDGTTFGATASIPAAGGNLYVRYTPTAVGANNGTVTLSSTEATDVTISLTGSGLDCSNITVPFTEGFESSIDCWTMVSMDPANDDKFGIFADASAYAGSSDFRFSSYSTASDYNQYLITPELTLGAGQTYMVKFYYKGYNANENFKVLYSTTTNDLSSFTVLADYTNVATSWTQTALELPAGTKYVAINYYGNYQFYLYVDEITIAALSAPDVTISGPVEVEAGNSGTFTATSPLADSYAWMVDGTTVPGTTETLTYTFNTAGTHNVKVIATNNIGSSADSMDVDVYVCDAIAQFPFNEGFENGLRCWGMVSMNEANNGNFGILNNENYSYEGSHAFMFSSYSSADDYNQYLITPELQIPAGANYMFNFFYMGYTSDDNFKVLYSTTTDDISSFIMLADYQDVANDWTETGVALPAGTKYVAINYYGEYSYYLFVDNISIQQLTAPTVTITGVTSIEAGSTAEFTAVSPLAESFAWTVDGNAVAGNTNTLVYTFTTTGNHTVGVTATNSVGSATATLTVNVYTCDGVQNLPYFEGFEGGLGCWTDIDNDGDTYSWASTLGTTIEAYEGNGCMLSNSYVNNVGAVEPDNWLVSPALAIPSEGAKLTWYVAAQDPSWPSENYDVMISTGTALSGFTSLFNETLESGDWEQRSVNINGNWAGKTVYIAFRHHDVTDMFAMKIDNVNVTAGVGVENHEMSTNIYPNPANNVLNINATSNINRVTVYNMMGQLIGSYNANSVNTQINTSSFANGVYTVKIETENGTTTSKFTVAR